MEPNSSPASFDPDAIDQETIASYYSLLELKPGATIEAVDQAYFRLKRQARQSQDPQRNTPEHLAALKTAHHTVKAMLQHYFYPATEESSTAVDPDLSSTEQFILGLKKVGIDAKLSLRDRELHLGLSLAQCPQATPCVSQIYNLLKILQPEDFAAIETVFVYGLRKPKDAAWQRKFPFPRRGQQSSFATGQRDLFSFTDPWTNAIVFPLISLLAILANQMPLVQFLLTGIKIWIHEWGHATIAWLGGYNAIPLPFGWTSVAEERSPWVYGTVLLVLGLVFRASWQEQRRWVMGIAVSLALLQIWMTGFISEDAFQVLLAFGGVGGEFYLSTLIMVSFFFPLPDYFRWDFNRFPLVFCAAFTFWGSLDFWHKIDRGQAFIPWGSLLGGEGDSGGDMDTLVLYGWSHDRIIDTYTGLADGCLLVIFGIYGYILFQQNRSLLFDWWHRWNGRG